MAKSLQIYLLIDEKGEYTGYYSYNIAKIAQRHSFNTTIIEVPMQDYDIRLKRRNTINGKRQKRME